MQLRLTVGGAWRVMMDMPCAHYLLDMQNAKDRVIARKVTSGKVTSGIFLQNKKSCSHIYIYMLTLMSASYSSTAPPKSNDIDIEYM